MTQTRSVHCLTYPIIEQLGNNFPIPNPYNHLPDFHVSMIDVEPLRSGNDSLRKEKHPSFQSSVDAGHPT